jgi:hypothetical protein
MGVTDMSMYLCRPPATGWHIRSIAHMSIRHSSLHLVPRRSTPNPQVCARLLGEHIRAARLTDGRPLEKLAPQAGLTVPIWESIEAGETPCAWECICMMAVALHLGRSWVPRLSRLWAGTQPLSKLG